MGSISSQFLDGSSNQIGATNSTSWFGARTSILPEVKITCSKITGDSVVLDISPSESVQKLKNKLAEHLVVGAKQIKLLAGSAVLQDFRTLASQGLSSDAEVTIVIMPPVPEWAVSLGLDGEHPDLCRAYFEKHQLPFQGYASGQGVLDEDVWREHETALIKVRESRQGLNNWNSNVVLKEAGDLPNAMIRTTPGSRVILHLTGSIWNKDGDTCIHQLLLVLDLDIVADLYDGVPRNGEQLRETVTITAPSFPGTYMLWKSSDLQYSMHNARRNLQNRLTRGPPPDALKDVFPGKFMAWLIVE